METALREMENECRGKAVGIPLFDEETAHLLLAAADFVLVPSRFEPCGLVAQSGCCYGAVPVVTKVGGLKDLVTPEASCAHHHPSAMQYTCIMRPANRPDGNYESFVGRPLGLRGCAMLPGL